MDKTIVGLLGGASALALMGGAGTSSAEPATALQPAKTYAELLDPIPDASARLRAENDRPASVELVQYDYGYGHHHHHHHHHRYRRYYGYAPWYRHHHHHHHNHVVIPLPGF